LRMEEHGGPAIHALHRVRFNPQDREEMIAIEMEDLAIGGGGESWKGCSFETKPIFLLKEEAERPFYQKIAFLMARAIADDIYCSDLDFMSDGSGRLRWLDFGQWQLIPWRGQGPKVQDYRVRYSYLIMREATEIYSWIGHRSGLNFLSAFFQGLQTAPGMSPEDSEFFFNHVFLSLGKTMKDYTVSNSNIFEDTHPGLSLQDPAEPFFRKIWEDASSFTSS
ncbi:MAG TPA: hypothetical protein VJQ25_01255, partial [Nitrospira sp.]|nr:hypothetical protein [Nitrospira sp.]